MLQSAVDNVSAVDAVAHRLYTAVDFRNHAAGDDSVTLEHGNLADVDNGNQALVVVNVAQQTANVGHQNQFFRAQLCRNLRRGKVGVDVIHIAVIAARNGGDNRQIAVLHGVLQRFGVDLADFSDKAQISSAGHQLVCHQQLAVQAAKTQRLAAVTFKQLHKALVYLARQHHLHNVNCFLVGHAHTVFKAAFLADGVEHRVDFGTAAVHQHHIDANQLHEHQVAHNGGFQILINHRVAAVFHDNRFARPFFNIGHCLN